MGNLGRSWWINLPGGDKEYTNCFSVNPTQSVFLPVLEETEKIRMFARDVWFKNMLRQCELGISHLFELNSSRDFNLPFIPIDAYHLPCSVEVHAALKRENIGGKKSFNLKRLIILAQINCSPCTPIPVTIVFTVTRAPFYPNSLSFKKLLNSTHEPCWAFPWTPLAQALCYLYSLKLIKVFLIFITGLTSIAEAYSAISRIPLSFWKFSKWKYKNTNEFWQPEVLNLVCGFRWEERSYILG